MLVFERLFKVLVINPKAMCCLCLLGLNSLQVTLTDLLREQNAESTVCLSYLDVSKQLGNCCVPFKGFKGKSNLGLTYLKAQNRVRRGQNARRKVGLTFFDIKMQQTMFAYHVWSINAQRNVQLRYLHVLKRQERLHYIKIATSNHFRGFKALGNVKPLCLERKFKEPSIE